MIDATVLIEVAWAGGLFEGEGSFRSSTTVTGAKSPSLGICMTDIEPLERIQRLFGGRISGPYSNPKRPATKPIFHWYVTDWDNFERIGHILLPWLSPRRTQRFKECLAMRPERWRKARVTVLCDYAPSPSPAGYLRHRRHGEKPCSVCMESNRLYNVAAYRKDVEKRKAYQRDWYRRRRAERQRVQTSEIMD